MTVEFYNGEGKWRYYTRTRIVWVPDYAETAAIFGLAYCTKSTHLELNFKDIIDGNVKIASDVTRRKIKNSFRNGKKKCIFDSAKHQKYLDRTKEFIEGFKTEKFKCSKNGYGV